MSGIGSISAYQQSSQISKGADRTTGAASSKASSGSSLESRTSIVETKDFSPIETGSSLVPKKTEYGNTIGNVQLSEKAANYLDKLKSKFGNMEFITVSKDMKAQVHKNAAAYGNSGKMVVLIDEEKLERMATDESYRKKYEGIIATSQLKMAEAKNSLKSSGASVKNFGMSVDSNGNESFFATVGKSQDLQKERIGKKAAQKKEQKAKEKKRAEKEAREERLQKAKDKKAEGKEKTEDEAEVSDIDDTKEYVNIEAQSLDELLSKVQTYSYNGASQRVMTASERMLGSHVDFSG